jgi:hypothetical protein
MKMFPRARTLAGILAVAASVTAQQPRLYEPGEMVEMDGGETYEILRASSYQC